MDRPPQRRNPDESSEARPSGTPLGRAFLIRPTPFNEDLIAAVRVCASLHGDGPLPPIPMRLEPLSSRVQARFWYDPDGPISIVVNPALPHRAFSVVHEIGHFLDYAGFDTPNRFSSESSEELAPWRTVVAQSRRVRELEQAVETVSALVPPDDASTYHGYLERPELWARSYAQYVTIRSRNQLLLAGLATHRRSEEAEAGTIERLLHWDDGDFAPIAAAIEALFRRLEWRSE